MQSLGNYTILSTLTESGPSSVYLAQHTKLNRKTLLKVYSGGDEKLIERFEREAKIVADLDSTSIVQIYDFGQAAGKYFISMEYVDGSNLSDYLASHELSDDEIIDYACQITRGLSILHQKGYIHRDLKPENILVSRSGQVKLTDFGISLHDSLSRVTSEGAILGTPLYMSPEQINNLKLSSTSDIFSLGIIFYQMVTGKNPYEAEQIGQIFYKILSENPPSLCDLRPSLPGWFCELVRKMLIKDPEKRPPSALAVLKVFEQNLNRNEDTQLSSPVLTPNKPEYNFKKLGLPAAIVTFLVIILLLYMYYPDNEIPVAHITFDPSQQETIHSNPDQAVQGDNLNSDQAPSRPAESGENSVPVHPANDAVISGNEPTLMLIHTIPWCNIYLDYRLIDQTPMNQARKLSPGKYVLGLMNPEYLISYSDTIFIEPNQLNDYTFDFNKIYTKVQLDANPWGQVYIDGKLIGTTPFQNPVYLSRQKHLIEIKNKFFKTWRDSVDLSDKDEFKHYVVLQKE